MGGRGSGCLGSLLGHGAASAGCGPCLVWCRWFLFWAGYQCGRLSLMAGDWPGLTGSSSGLGGQLCTSESPPWLCDNLMLRHCVCSCWLTGPSLAGWGYPAQTSIIPGFRVGVIGSGCAGSASLGSPLCWEVGLVYLGSPLKCGGVSDSLGSSSRRRAGSASLSLLMG